MHYDPLKDKTPYGAAVAGEPVAFRFALPAAESADKVTVILRRGAEEFRSDLRFARFEGDDIVYEGSVTAPVAGLWYYRFESVSGGRTSYYGRGRGGCAVCGEWLPEWQLTVTKRAYKTPDWAKSGVVYQIFADRFAREGAPDFRKKGRLHADWYDLPDIAEEGQDYRADDFFGGNAEGVISRLDYLAELGVTTLYLSPVFLSSSNHRYDTADYMRADELFGGDEGVKKLCAEAHGRGMRIVLDGVFNHTGADSVYFNKFGNFDSVGAYQSKQSPYYDWYTFYDYPDSYHCWWGSTVVPTVNKDAKGFRSLVLGKGGVIDKWTKAGADGWRLDVVDELPTGFTEELCAKIRRADKDALVIGEVWEDASDKVSYGTWRPYFMGDELDGVMNYPFRRAIFDLIMKGDREGFRDAVTLIAEHYPKESMDVCFTLIGSHDTVRALTALSGAEAPYSKAERRAYRLSDEYYAFAKLRLKAAAILQYTLPGVPCVYYGDEAGVQGFEDPLNRATYPWGREDDDLVGHYRALGELRRRNANALRGTLRFLDDSDLTVFERVSEDGKDVLRTYYNPCFHTIYRDVNALDAFTGDAVDTLAIPPLSACAVAYSLN